MKNILSNFTVFQRVLLIFSIVAYTICALVINTIDGWIAFASCLTFAIYLVFNANAKWISFVWIIVSYLIYMYFNIKEVYWGEFATSVMSIAINFVAMLQWKKHTSDNKLKINRISALEIVLTTLSMLTIALCLYFLLNAINSELVILNALSFSVIIVEYYLTFRRTVWKYVFGIISAIVYILLWFFAMQSITDYALIFVVNGFLNIVWYVDGIVQWTKLSNNK